MLRLNGRHHNPAHVFASLDAARSGALSLPAARAALNLLGVPMTGLELVALSALHPGPAPHTLDYASLLAAQGCPPPPAAPSPALLAFTSDARALPARAASPLHRGGAFTSCGGQG